MTTQADKLKPVTGASESPSAAPVAPAGNDLAQVEAVIDEAQRAAGALAHGLEESAHGTMNEIVAAIEQVESAAKPPTLKQYDQAIAKAVDDLLEGDFVSVDLVLEGMHETTPPPAPLKQAADSAPAAPHPAAVAPPPPPAAAKVETTTQSDGAAAVSSPAHVAEAAPPKSTAEVVSKVAEPVATTKPSIAAVSEPAPAAVATAPSVQPPSPRKPGINPSVALASAAQHVRAIGKPFKAALVLLSKPLDVVPPKARDIVSWVALSLLVWVPIVWIFALLLV